MLLLYDVDEKFNFNQHLEEFMSLVGLTYIYYSYEPSGTINGYWEEELPVQNIDKYGCYSKIQIEEAMLDSVIENMLKHPGMYPLYVKIVPNDLKNNGTFFTVYDYLIQLCNSRHVYSDDADRLIDMFEFREYEYGLTRSTYDCRIIRIRTHHIPNNLPDCLDEYEKSFEKKSKERSKKHRRSRSFEYETKEVVKKRNSTRFLILH